jgi:phosphoglycerol transferase
MATAGFQKPLENTYSKLGLTGSLGFLFLVGFILTVLVGRPFRVERNDSLLGACAALMLACLLLATIGGFGAFFNVFVAPDIRCYNRIVPFIEYFCVTAVVFVLALTNGWWSRRRWPDSVFVLMLASLTIFAGADQAMVSEYLKYEGRQQMFSDDAVFVREIEATLPEGSAVFELPYTPFPLESFPGKMAYYDQAKPYLHSNNLRWSWGAMEGRAGDTWVKRVAMLSVPNMLHKLVHAGFSGLWVDQFGYINGDSPESQLSQMLDAAPIRNGSGRILFYDLRSFAAKVTREESMMSRAELFALHPIEIIPDGGVYDIEINQIGPARWSAKRSGFVLRNELNIPRSIEVRATMETQGSGEITIKQQGTSDKIATSGIYNYKHAVELPAGVYVRLDLVCDCKPVTSPLDSQPRYLNLINLRAIDLSEIGSFRD